MITYLMPVARQRFFDNNGLPLAGGQLFTYAAGTTSPKVTYQDNAGTANSNPVVLDADGYCDLWIGTGNYKFVLEDSLGNILWTKDYIGLAGTTSNSVPAGGTQGQVLGKNSGSDYDTVWMGPFQKGLVSLANAVQSVVVTFPVAFADINYAENFNFENVTDANPIFLQGMVTAKTTAGFTVSFNAPTDSANYVFSWTARD